MQNGVYINGNFVTFDELWADVQAAMKNGYAHKFAFTPETVQALLEFIARVKDEG
jgi:hypothetical protein